MQENVFTNKNSFSCNTEENNQKLKWKEPLTT